LKRKIKQSTLQFPGKAHFGNLGKPTLPALRELKYGSFEKRVGKLI
jgi:hypothetical protein